MKKIIISAIAVIAAATLSSCMGTGSTTSYNTTDSAVKANEAYAMTAEKAEGLYALDSMDKVGENTKESYKTNTIHLGADGTFEFNVEVGAMSNTETGTYTIGANGVVTFADDFAIVAADETVVCDGNKLTAEGKLGRSTITMNFAKTVEAPKTEDATEKEAE